MVFGEYRSEVLLYHLVVLLEVSIIIKQLGSRESELGDSERRRRAAALSIRAERGNLEELGKIEASERLSTDCKPQVLPLSSKELLGVRSRKRGSARSYHSVSQEDQMIRMTPYLGFRSATLVQYRARFAPLPSRSLSHQKWGRAQIASCLRPLHCLTSALHLLHFKHTSLSYSTVLQPVGLCTDGATPLQSHADDELALQFDMPNTTRPNTTLLYNKIPEGKYLVAALSKLH